MPTYCYSDPDGKDVRELQFPFGKAPLKIFASRFVGTSGEKTCGWYTRDFQAEHVSVPPASCWPMEPCVSSGVHPDQAGELREHFRRNGLDIEVNSDGDPIYRSSSQRKAAMKSRGQHDRASYN